MTGTFTSADGTTRCDRCHRFPADCDCVSFDRVVDAEVVACWNALSTRFVSTRRYSYEVRLAVMGKLVERARLALESEEEAR